MRNLWLLSLTLMLAYTTAGYAQADPALAQGLIPYQSYHEGDIDSVN